MLDSTQVGPSSRRRWVGIDNLTGYETTKRFFAKQYNPAPVPVWALLVSGATGGVCYWLACYPLDVVKSRIQLADKPPTRGGWLHGGYVGRELKTIVNEAGTYVHPSYLF